MRIQNIPNDAKMYGTEQFQACTIPADGFEKLIGYSTKKGEWVHKDFRAETRTKKGKKTGK